MLRIAALAAILFLFWGVGAALAAEPAAQSQSPADEIMKEQAGEVQTEQVDRYWQQLVRDYGGFFPESKAPSLVDMLLPGGQPIRPGAAAKGLLRYFFHEIAVNGKLLATIVILTVFSMILETLQSAFERSAVSKTAYAICYMVLTILAVNSFTIAIGYAKSAISGMIDFMLAVIPILLSLLASTGGIVTVSVLHPLIIFMIHVISTVIYIVVFPLLFFSTILHIVSSISDQYKVTRLANLLRTAGTALLGVVVAAFLGIISVQGATGAVADSVTIRTAKFVSGSFIPVVGKLFSEAADTVAGASLLVKNSIGLSGVVIILLLCAFPAVKILTLALIYNLCAAVLQPLGDSPIAGCLQTIGKNMIYVFAALAAVGLMFFLAITIIIAAGNASVLMR